MRTPSFLTLGKKTGEIDVRISLKVIELFSEGLYASPHKAVEELVANAFDAGATNVRVIAPSMPVGKQSTLVVADDGEGMDGEGLREHWLIGESHKRDIGYKNPRGRAQIGRFGIGKLATFVLARRLTHISKRKGRFYATTMDFAKVPGNQDGGLDAAAPVHLDLRELTMSEAQKALEPWFPAKGGAKGGPNLFGSKASPSWTVAILSELKDMAGELKLGVLRWVLSTAMPIRDDFALYLNEEQITAAKLKQKRVKLWILGNDVTALPKPAPADDISVAAPLRQVEGFKKHGFGVVGLGRVSGFIELYRDPIDTGKSEELARSNGFFVYVRDRLINESDEGFGIDRNLLRHGTFSRFRMVLHADGLDSELRSSREAFRDGPLLARARLIAHGAFNLARNAQEKIADDLTAGAGLRDRFSGSPATLTSFPVAALVEEVFDKKYVARLFDVPTGLEESARDALVSKLRAEPVETTAGEDTALVPAHALIKGVTLSDSGGPGEPLARLEVATGLLRINQLHPFVAYFIDEFESPKSSLPLELLAASEVLIEAQLRQGGTQQDVLHAFLDRRDQLLRDLAVSTGRRPASLVAQALEDAGSNQDDLETELVAAFHSMGFSAVRISGKGEPDGIADAHLGFRDGASRAYRVMLEAKSKEKLGAKTSAKAVGVSGIHEHRKKHGGQHILVASPDFDGSAKEESSLSRQIAENRSKNEGLTLTAIRLTDLATLVRQVPLKRIGLDRVQRMLVECSMPADATTWVERLVAEKTSQPPFREILDVIAEEQRLSPGANVEFSVIRVKLREKQVAEYPTNDPVRSACLALAQYVPNQVIVTDTSVSLSSRPDHVLSAVRSQIQALPPKERAASDMPAI